MSLTISYSEVFAALVMALSAGNQTDINRQPRPKENQRTPKKTLLARELALDLLFNTLTGDAIN